MSVTKTSLLRTPAVVEVEARRSSATQNGQRPPTAHDNGQAGAAAEPRIAAGVKNLTDLSGLVAVVIGGTSGLGQAIAVGMAQCGASVVPSGRRLDRLDETCEQIRAIGRQTLSHPVDVTDRASIEALRDAVVDEFGRVDILVNAAGRTLKKPTLEITESEWMQLMDVNLAGVLRSCQIFYEALKASGRGRIINIASLASYVAFHEVAAYGASKAGVLALTRSLGIEWARSGINVNAIIPGIFPTDLNAAILDGTERGRELITRTPLGRFGRHDEIVGVAAMLASNCASYMVGQAIAVDGGFLASGVNS